MKCPMCKSNNISDDIITEGLWRCDDCNYVSNWSDFLEEEFELVKNKKSFGCNKMCEICTFVYDCKLRAKFNYHSEYVSCDGFNLDNYYFKTKEYCDVPIKESILKEKEIENETKRNKMS